MDLAIGSERLDQLKSSQWPASVLLQGWLCAGLTVALLKPSSVVALITSNHSIITMTPKIKLTYFDVFGRAGPIRLALAVGGIEFEDVRLTREEFLAQKEAGAYTFGMLPVMEIDGEMLAESAALLRYAGKLSKLYPEDPKDAVKVDMVTDGLENLVAPMMSDPTPEGREKFLQDVLPRYMKPVNDIVAKSAGGPFVLGDKMSIADLTILSFVGYLTSGMADHVPKDCLNSYSHILAIAKAVGDNEKIAAWNKEREKQ